MYINTNIYVPSIRDMVENLTAMDYFKSIADHDSITGNYFGANYMHQRAERESDALFFRSIGVDPISMECAHNDREFDEAENECFWDAHLLGIDA